jgi:hypothetical protein
VPALQRGTTIASQMSRGKRCRRLASYALLALVLGLVTAYVVKNWSAVAEVQLAQPEHLVVGSVIGLLGLLAFVRVAQMLISAHGFDVRYPAAVGLLFIPMLGKYIPGKVWSVLAAFWVYSRVGIPKPVAATCTGMAIILSYVSALLVATMSGAVDASVAGFWLPMLLAAALLACIHPAVFYPLINWGLRVLGRDEIDSTLSFPALLRLLVLDTVGWGLYGAGFFFVVGSVTGGATPSLVHLMGLFALAQALGFAAIFAPSGIGVREGVFVIGLAPVVGEGAAIVIAGLCRVWQTLLELVLTAIGWWGLARDGATHPTAPGSPPSH